MKAYNQTSTIHRLLTTAVLSLLFVVVSLSFIPGCATTGKSSDATTPPAGQETTDAQAGTDGQSTQPEGSDVQSDQSEDTSTLSDETTLPRLSLDQNPDPLSSDSKESSLEGYGAKGALADKDLTINDMLVYAVQDEYLAHGEYQAIIEKFGEQRPYTNIMKSEETHLSLLEEVYGTYGMDFPADSSAEHIIIPSTLLEAAQTGVQAEIDNIAMYEIFLTYDLPENVQQAFTVLRNASESHLQAFQNQVDRLS